VIGCTGSAGRDKACASVAELRSRMRRAIFKDQTFRSLSTGGAGRRAVARGTDVIHNDITVCCRLRPVREGLRGAATAGPIGKKALTRLSFVALACATVSMGAASVAHAQSEAGSVSLPVSVAIVLETHGPKTQALNAARALQGRNVKLRFRILSALSPQASVRIAVRSMGGRVVRVVSLGLQPTGRVCAAVIAAPTISGSYRYEVRATDLAGNRQIVMGANSLLVRR
jgi:hypothetical protein